MTTFSLAEHSIRLETDRSGPFTLQVGVDVAAVQTLYLRVSDAQERFRRSPLSSVASRLEQEVVVSSVFGTNSIEGGTLNEQQTKAALDLDPAEVQDTEQRRAVNIKAAYDLARDAAADPAWGPDLGFVRALHAAITDRLPHERDRQGVPRDNPKGIFTRIGDEVHGGNYKPPCYGRDIQRLLDALLSWHAEFAGQGVPSLIRAPLVHYYYELIHPFWDGNGRVGRVLEASILLADGFRYAPFAQARFYLGNIDRYFTLFNVCRKAAAAGQETPNTPFVAFFLEGMLASINRLQDRANRLVDEVLFDAGLGIALESRELNKRQVAIASAVSEHGGTLSLSDLRRAPWYQAMYLKRTDKTKQRDLRGLREGNWLREDRKGRLLARFIPEGTDE